MSDEQNSQTTLEESITAGSITSTITNSHLSRMEAAINRLLEPTATTEDFLAAMDTEAALMEVTKQYRSLLKDAAIRFIEEHGEVETVTARFYVGTSKTTKCRDVRSTVDAILQAAGGDFEAFVSCLSSQPLKNGECRKLFGDSWDQHFTTETKLNIKTGKPTRSIKRALPGKEGM